MEKRIIKFRLWNKIRKEMEMVTGIIWGNVVKFSDDVSSISTPTSDYGPEHTVLMQFTGLKDKNGKDIYEGDIVEIPANKRHPKYVGKVVWDQSNCGFEIQIPKSGWMPIESHNEIIGNIYENPELIK